MYCMEIFPYIKNVLYKGSRACLSKQACLKWMCSLSFCNTVQQFIKHCCNLEVASASIPFCHAADNLLLKIGEEFPDEKVLFLSDILCTAWHGTELGKVGKGDTVAIWGQGPGRFACFLEMPEMLKI